MMDNVVVACCGNCQLYLEHGVCEYFNSNVDKDGVPCGEYEFSLSYDE